jgi:hypothetical protein
MRSHAFACGLLTLVAIAGPSRAADALPADGGTQAADPSKATVTTLREAGVAMFYWAADLPGGSKGEAEVETKADPAPAAAAEPATVRWSRCPAMSYDEVRELVVPRYIAELPRTDAWGHPLEFCVDREGAKNHGHFALGVRSAGADGRFDGDEYKVGAFDLADVNHDLVWLDGYFMAWPMRQPSN